MHVTQQLSPSASTMRSLQNRRFEKLDVAVIHLEDAIVQFECIFLLYLHFFKYTWVHLHSNALHFRPIMPFLEEVVITLLNFLINPFEIDFIYL